MAPLLGVPLFLLPTFLSLVGALSELLVSLRHPSGTSHKVQICLILVIPHAS